MIWWHPPSFFGRRSHSSAAPERPPPPILQQVLDVLETPAIQWQLFFWRLRLFQTAFSGSFWSWRSCSIWIISLQSHHATTETPGCLGSLHTQTACYTQVPTYIINHACYVLKLLQLGKPSFQKRAVFLNIVQKAFGPPPFYLNICPILRGVFFKRVFEH